MMFMHISTGSLKVPLCRRKLLAIRGLFGFGAIGCYFFAVTKLPLNDTMVLTFLAPLVVALASPVVIKENPPK